MKEVSPNDTSHTLTFIPRFYPNEIMLFELKNKVTKDVIDMPHTYNVNNGILYIDFNYTFINKNIYQLTIKEDTDIVYRGALKVTDRNG